MPDQAETKGFGRLGGCVFAALMLGASAVLASTVLTECDVGADAVRDYASAVRGGQDVSEAVGGDEAAALTEVLRQTRSVAVENFQGQAATQCVWARLTLEGGAHRSARFVVREGTSAVVVRASLRRECECPDPDFEQPCDLR